MLPLYVPAARAAELTLTVKLDGVVLFRLALVASQFEPEVTVTVKPTPAVPDALLMVRDWAAGLEPCCAVKVNDVGDTVTFPELPPPLVLTVNVTGTVWITPLALKETVAL